MFTGIITDVANVLEVKKRSGGLTIKIQRPAEWADLKLGESIAVNGVCLTVAVLNKDGFVTELMTETLDKTTFGKTPPTQVNLERAMLASDRLGGHLVQGHVDCVGKIIEINQDNGNYSLTIDFPPRFKYLLANKGSITVNGVSLTVITPNKNSFGVSLVPHTIKHTTLKSLKVGDYVNLEFDMIAKHVFEIMKKR